MRFRLLFYETKEANRFAAERRLEYLGDQEAIWQLWFMLHKGQGWPHVYVFNLAGEKQEPGHGIYALHDYNP